MPRRPRPSSRRPPPTSQVADPFYNGNGQTKPSTPIASSSKVRLMQPKRVVREDNEDEGSDSNKDEDEGLDQSQEEDEEDKEEEEEEEGEDLDADAPRIVQWVDEEELDLESSDEDDEEEGAGGHAGIVCYTIYFSLCKCFLMSFHCVRVLYKMVRYAQS